MNAPTEPGVYCVNGTPVMACLYGIDVKAPRVFGRAPDLVITGPNEGNNTGHINNSSGTFNTMLYAVNRGLPAVAISDAATTQVTWSTSLAPTARPFEVADIIVKLLGQLTRQSLGGGGTVRPSGTVMPTDRSVRSEANVIESRAAITVSPVQGIPEATGLFLSRMRATLHAHD